MKKSVKIIGLSVNKQFGILQACKLQFDNNNMIVKVKGAVGEGKTTLQKSLQLGTQGSKTLVDKELYGEVNIETQLLDGDMPIFVGCKSDKNGKLIYTLYTKDADGNVIKDPVIDGVKATPSKYLEMLQTELTWKMDELTSENPNVQKKILLKLYQHKLKEIGVIFDKKNPDYKHTILHKIEVAEQQRNMADAMRKQHGGIAEDLKARGYDVYRPDTLPVRVNIEDYEKSLQKLREKIAVGKATIEAERQNKLQQIKQKASDLTNEALIFNQSLKAEYDARYKEYIDKFNAFNFMNQQKANLIEMSNEALENLKELGYQGYEVAEWIASLPQVTDECDFVAPKEPTLITIQENKVVADEVSKEFDIVKKIMLLRQEYQELKEKELVFNISKIEQEIAVLEQNITLAKETNKVCDAVDSFFAWQNENENVLQLKQKYVKLLSKIDTGVEGLKIIPKENDLFLMYDGSYDPKYFNNPGKEMRKLSSYSGTQKPIICLLVQNYLLNQKPKSMRYMYIDNVPMDNKTIDLLEEISEELDLRIFLNITGDFEKHHLGNGEILIEGGEVFFI